MPPRGPRRCARLISLRDKSRWRKGVSHAVFIMSLQRGRAPCGSGRGGVVGFCGGGVRDNGAGGGCESIEGNGGTMCVYGGDGRGARAG